MGRRARSGSGCRFESGYEPVVLVALTILFVLVILNEVQKPVKKARKMIKKAVVPMCRALRMIMSWRTVLTGGLLAWTGCDDRQLHTVARPQMQRRAVQPGTSDPVRVRKRGEAG